MASKNWTLIAEVPSTPNPVGGDAMRIERVPIGMETLGEAREQAERMSKLVQKALIGAYRDPQYATGWYVRVVVDRQVIARLVSREEVDRFLEGYVSTATASKSS